MRTIRVFVDRPLTCNIPVELSAEASHHVATVLRMRKGEVLEVFNGEGGSYRARIAGRGRGTVTIEPFEFDALEREAPLSITLAQGISRSQHMDYTLQKAVELGVRRIVPLVTAFSNVRLADARVPRRLQHWRSVIISACEQCGRNAVPVLLPPRSLSDWTAGDADPLRLILDPRGNRTLGEFAGAGTGTTILSGPEGGFSEEEYETALRCGYAGIRLGPRILRTETAALTALALCQCLWGDLR